MVKPLSILVPVLSLCLLFLLLLPLLTRPEPGKILNVSIQDLPSTALQASTAPAPTVISSAIDSGANDGNANDGELKARVPQSGVLAAGSETLTYPGLGEFANTLLNGSPEQLVGVYINGVLALPVQQQPEGQPDYVSTEANMLTQFHMPKNYGTVGILAHNYLSGSRFPQISQGAEIVLVYGGGEIKRYHVTHAETFQALNPNSPFSNFIDLEDPEQKVLTSAQLFKHMYSASGRLVFQTCIEANGEPSWGRLFIVAEPADAFTLTIPALDSLNNLN